MPPVLIVPGEVMTAGLPKNGAPTTEKVKPLGSPVALNWRLWLTPMAEAGGVSATAMELAVPLTSMTWGELGALSVSVMVSESWPVAIGTKVTEMVHVPRKATEPLQLFVVAKSVGLEPAMTTEEMFRAPAPVFVTVMVVGVESVPWLMAGKMTGFGATVTAGTAGGGCGA